MENPAIGKLQETEERNRLGKQKFSDSLAYRWQEILTEPRVPLKPRGISRAGMRQRNQCRPVLTPGPHDLSDGPATRPQMVCVCVSAQHERQLNMTKLTQ